MWDGVGWRDVGGGVRGEIFSLARYEDYLVAGGSFRVTESPSIIDLALWDGAQWSAIPSIEQPGNVQAVAGWNDRLYMFAFFDGSARVAYWDGSTFNFLGDPFSGSPTTFRMTLRTSPSRVFLGFWGERLVGNLRLSGGALWDRGTWTSMDGGVSGCTGLYCVNRVEAACWDDSGGIICAGFFKRAGGVQTEGFAGWKEGWTKHRVQAHFSGAIVRDDDDLYWSGITLDGKGGVFRETAEERIHVSEKRAYVLSRHGGDVVMAANSSVGNPAGVTRIEPQLEDLGKGFNTVLGNGLGRPGEAVIVAPDGSAVALGVFVRAGHVSPLHQIAGWNGTTWFRLLERNDFWEGTRIYTAAYADGELFVGGTMNQWPGVHFNVARVRDRVLERLGGSDVDGTVRALAAGEGSVYIGGDFTSAAGLEANHVVVWRNDSWHRLGNGVNGSVRALATRGEHVVTAGDFSAAGEIEAGNIALWDGTTWRGLGDGFDDVVRTVVTDGDAVFAGGPFKASGETLLNHVGVWRSERWRPLGAGLNGEVIRLAISDAGWLYAAGRFTKAGEVDAQHVAAWDGRNWHALGSGVNGNCWGAAADRGRVFFAGEFLKAGGKLSHYFAEWAETEPPPVHLTDVAIAAGSERVELSWQLDAILSVQGFNVYRSRADGSGTTKLTEGLLPPSVRELTDPSGEPETAYVYELGVVRYNGFEQREPLGVATTQPLPFSLAQNYPNPFNPSTTIVYTVPKRGHVSLELFDVAGRSVRRLIDEVQTAGTKVATWDGANDSGEQVASGVYLYRLTVGSRMKSKKMAVVR